MARIGIQWAGPVDALLGIEDHEDGVTIALGGLHRTDALLSEKCPQSPGGRELLFLGCGASRAGQREGRRRPGHAVGSG